MSEHKTELCDEHYGTSYTGEGDQYCLICSMQKRIAALEAEVAEQARLLGISGSREAVLLQRIAALEKVAELMESIRKEPYEHSWPEMDELLIAAGYLPTHMED